MKINVKQIAYNRVKRASDIRYIVIHDTGNKSKGADAEAHYKYFNGGDRSSSADFFVDDEQVLQVNDYTKFYTWHVGDGKGKYGITNQNSVGIEICVNADGDYQKAAANAVELTKYLMKKLGIPAERVVRHYDASRKKCPASMAENDWAGWKEFCKKIVAEDTPFDDIGESFAKRDIEELYAMGIISGVGNGKFAPAEPVSREAVARIARNVIRYITGE